MKNLSNIISKFSSIEKTFEKFTLSEILDIVEALANELLQVEYSDTELLYENHLAKDIKDEDKQEKQFLI